MFVDSGDFILAGIEKGKAIVVASLVLDERPEQGAAVEVTAACNEGLEQFGDRARVAPVAGSGLDVERLVMGHRQRWAELERMGVGLAVVANSVKTQVQDKGAAALFVERIGLMEHCFVVGRVLEDLDLTVTIRPSDADAIGIARDSALNGSLESGQGKGAVGMSSNE